MQRALDILQSGIDDGLHLGAQIYASQGGQVLIDDAIGQATPGQRLTRDHLMLWMSAGKPVTAIAAALQVREGRLDLESAVADHIDGFGRNRKAGVRVKHLLTHTAGLRQVGRNWDGRPWGQIIEDLCNASLEPGWTPGEKAGYHTASTMYLLAEVMRTVDGLAGEDSAISAMLRERVLLPFGMSDSWIGMPRQVYESVQQLIVPAYDTSKGTLHAQEFPNSELGCLVCRPGGNARGPARELGQFYQQLLTARRGDEVIRQFTSPQRVGMIDHTFKTQIDWGYGFLMQTGDGRHAYSYGGCASTSAFGHSGNQSSCAFADPQHDLAVAWVTNGMPGEAKHQARARAINDAVYNLAGVN